MNNALDKRTGKFDQYRYWQMNRISQIAPLGSNEPTDSTNITNEK
nr:MAG TPA: hypothetical protein [Caudoviricetes sp.]